MKNKFALLSFISGLVGIVFLIIFVVSVGHLSFYPNIGTPYLIIVLSFIFGLIALISGTCSIKEKEDKIGFILGIIGVIIGIILIIYFLYLNIMLNTSLIRPLK